MNLGATFCSIAIAFLGFAVVNQWQMAWVWAVITFIVAAILLWFAHYHPRPQEKNVTSKVNEVDLTQLRASRLILRATSDSVEHIDWRGFGVTAFRVCNAEEGFAYIVHNVRIEIAYKFIKTGEVFRVDGLMLPQDSLESFSEPGTSMSFAMLESAQIPFLVTDYENKQFCTFTRCPLNTLSERRLGCGKWELIVTARSDSDSDFASLRFELGLRPDLSSTLTSLQP